MSDYPLRGNRIEIHEREGDSRKDRRKYNVTVDEQLYQIIKEKDNWDHDPAMPGREIVSYRATVDDSSTAEYPLRGEGVEIRQDDKSGAWQGYSLYVAPDLRVKFTDEKGNKKPYKHGWKHDWKKTDDGRMVLGYYATDEGFYPAEADTHCI